MNAHPTLLKLLEQSTAQVLVYDIGRRIGAMPRNSFAAFERATAPYPLPMQRKAWFALVQVGGDSEPVIWFLSLSLDERGLIIPAERDYLLNRLLESAQASRRGKDPQVFLQDNPHAFTPREERMALFHARLSADLGRPPSRFYGHALNYFCGQLGWDQWGFVGYQGIADVACRHDGGPLDTAVPDLPKEPLVALCHCLESQTIDDRLTTALHARLNFEIDGRKADVGTVAALIRGLSSRAASTQTVDATIAVLDSPVGNDIEILAAIAGRAWDVLHNPVVLRRYLLRLATNDHGQAAFEHCVSDLLSLPTLAPALRTTLRAENQADVVRGAFNTMIGGGDAPPTN